MGAFRDKVKSEVLAADKPRGSAYSFKIEVTDADRDEATKADPEIPAKDWLKREAKFACVGHRVAQCEFEGDDLLWVSGTGFNEAR